MAPAVEHVNDEATTRVPDRLGAALENLSIVIALGAALVGFVIGVVILDGDTPLMAGRGSIGEIAAMTAAAVSGIGFTIVVLRFRGSLLPWYREVSRLRRIVDVLGLALMQATLTLFLTAGVFAILQGSFRRLALDQWAGAVLVAVACAVAAYLAANSAGTLSTESLALLTAGFLVVGAFASALSAGDELWWQVHFSALGTAADISGVTFNFTLILTGVVIVILADFLTHDLAVWCKQTGCPHWKVRLVRVLLGVMGTFLGLVGVIPVSLSLFWHNMVTYVAIGAFVVLLVGVPLLFPKLPKSNLLVTLVTAGSLGAALWLHFGIGYLNITAFEIIAVTIVLTWLVMFIRTLVAAVHDVLPAAPFAPITGASGSTPETGERMEP